MLVGILRLALEHGDELWVVERVRLVLVFSLSITRMPSNSLFPRPALERAPTRTRSWSPGQYIASTHRGSRSDSACNLDLRRCLLHAIAHVLEAARAGRVQSLEQGEVSGEAIAPGRGLEHVGEHRTAQRFDATHRYARGGCQLGQDIEPAPDSLMEQRRFERDGSNRGRRAERLEANDMIVSGFRQGFPGREDLGVFSELVFRPADGAIEVPR